MALTQARPQTITEAYLMAFGGDVGLDVIEGEVVFVSPSGREHGRIGARLIQMLLNHVDAQRLGEVFQDQVGYVLDGEPGDVRLMRAPDVSFVASSRAS